MHEDKQVVKGRKSTNVNYVDLLAYIQYNGSVDLLSQHCGKLSPSPNTHGIKLSPKTRHDA